MRNYQWTLQVSISIFKMYSIGKYWWFSFLELLLEVARGLGFDLKEIKPKVPLRKYSSKKLNFWDHHKLGRYCYGKPNHTNFVWSVCGTYVCRTGRSAGRGSSWDKKRWHFNQIKGYKYSGCCPSKNSASKNSAARRKWRGWWRRGYGRRRNSYGKNYCKEGEDASNCRPWAHWQMEMKQHPLLISQGILME